MLNLDNAETAALAAGRSQGQVITYSLRAAPADLARRRAGPAPAGIAFRGDGARAGETVEVTLKVPGLHNVANALAALGAAPGLRREPRRGGEPISATSPASGGAWRWWARPTA